MKCFHNTKKICFFLIFFSLVFSIYAFENPVGIFKIDEAKVIVQNNKYSLHLEIENQINEELGYTYEIIYKNENLKTTSGTFFCPKSCQKLIPIRKVFFGDYKIRILSNYKGVVYEILKPFKLEKKDRFTVKLEKNIFEENETIKIKGTITQNHLEEVEYFFTIKKINYPRQNCKEKICQFSFSVPFENLNLEKNSLFIYSKHDAKKIDFEVLKKQEKKQIETPFEDEEENNFEEISFRTLAVDQYTIDLADESDSGISNSDNITNKKQITLSALTTYNNTHNARLIYEGLRTNRPDKPIPQLWRYLENGANVVVPINGSQWSVNLYLENSSAGNITEFATQIIKKGTTGPNLATVGHLSITFDFENPTLNVLHPKPSASNYSYNLSFIPHFEYTDIINYEINGINYIYTENMPITLSSTGTHTIKVNSSDVAGNFNFTEHTFEVHNNSEKFDINIISPLENQNINNNTVLINFSVMNLTSSTPIDNLIINNETHNINYSSPIEINLSDGTHLLSFYVNSSNTLYQVSSRTLTIDTTKPQIEVTSPNPRSLFGKENLFDTKTILINFSATDQINDIDSLWYEFNGTNTSYTNSTNINITDGTYTLRFYANDTLGTIGFLERNITIDTSIVISHVIDLANESDSGISNSDNITNKKQIILSAMTNYPSQIARINFYGNKGVGTDTKLWQYQESGVGTVEVPIDSSGYWTYNLDIDKSPAENITQFSATILNTSNIAQQLDFNYGRLEITFDYELPSITKLHPKPSASNYSYNLKLTPQFESEEKITYKIDDINYNYAENTQITLSSSGTHTMTVNSSDIAGNSNLETYNFTTHDNSNGFFVNITAPTQSLSQDNQNITINFTTNGSADNLWINNGTHNISYSNPTNISLSYSTHTLRFYANKSNNTYVGSRIVSINIPLPITVNSPAIRHLLDKENLFNTSNIPINFSAYDIDGIDALWFSDDNGGTNLSYPSNTTIHLGNGAHTLTFYANDTLGNIIFLKRNITIDTSISFSYQIDLANESDSGISNSDNITNKKQITLRGLTGFPNQLAVIKFYGTRTPLDATDYWGYKENDMEIRVPIDSSGYWTYNLDIDKSNIGNITKFSTTILNSSNTSKELNSTYGEIETTLDYDPPSINITSPNETSDNIGGAIFNITTDTSNLSYILNNEEITYTKAEYINLSRGDYNLNISGEDLAGNFAYKTFSFFVFGNYLIKVSKKIRAINENLYNISSKLTNNGSSSRNTTIYDFVNGNFTYDSSIGENFDSSDTSNNINNVWKFIGEIYKWDLNINQSQTINLSYVVKGNENYKLLKNYKIGLE